MDPAILTATSGLIGSLIGAASSFSTTWLAQRGQLRGQARVQEAAKREARYAEFIAEVSKRLADAVSHQAESHEVIVCLHADVGWMRLVSSREVISAAEKLVHLVVETYASPDLTFAQVWERARAVRDFADPLADFGEACRVELLALRG
jgi:hypothetical protein